jgi:hypothetical protein
LPLPLPAVFSLAAPDLRLGLHMPRGAGGQIGNAVTEFAPAVEIRVGRR